MFLWGYVTWLKKSFDEKGIKKVIRLNGKTIIETKGMKKTFKKGDKKLILKK